MRDTDFCMRDADFCTCDVSTLRHNTQDHDSMSVELSGGWCFKKKIGGGGGGGAQTN